MLRGSHKESFSDVEVDARAKRVWSLCLRSTKALAVFGCFAVLMHGVIISDVYQLAVGAVGGSGCYLCHPPQTSNSNYN